MMPQQTRRIKEAWSKFSNKRSDPPTFVTAFVQTANTSCLRVRLPSHATYEQMWCVPFLCLDECRFVREGGLAGVIRFYPTVSRSIWVVAAAEGYACHGHEKLATAITKSKPGYISWRNLSMDIAWQWRAPTAQNDTADELNLLSRKITVLAEKMVVLTEFVESTGAAVRTLSAKPLPQVPSARSSSKIIIPPAPPSRECSEEE
jgi:hypothetical protein